MTSKRDLKLESDVLEKQPLTISFRKLIVFTTVISFFDSSENPFQIHISLILH